MAVKGMSVFTHQGEDYTINDQNIANEFSTSTAYAVGDHVTYQGNLYVFKNAHAAGSWSSSDVTQVKIGEEIKGLDGKAFRGRGNLSSSDDLDDILDIGTYGKSYAATPANWPFASNHAGRLNVFIPESNPNLFSFVQVAYDINDNRTAFRTALQDSWNDWEYVVNEKQITTDDYGETISSWGSWEKGTLVDGQEAANNKRIRSGYIDIGVGIFDRIEATARTSYKFSINYFNSEKSWLGNSGTWHTGTLVVNIPANTRYIRFVFAYEQETERNIADNRNFTATAYYKIVPDIYSIKKVNDAIRDDSEDVQIKSWNVGYIYGDGIIASASEQPQYVCVPAMQKFPFGIVITPDTGYQFRVLYFNESDLSVAKNSGWSKAPIHVPANTSFGINVSKVTPEDVTNIQTYINAIHVRSYAVNNIVSPAANKKTKIGILGDSISSYDGYIETGYNSAYYPKGDIESVNQMWWYIVAEALGATDGIMVSAISQSAFFDYGEAMYPPVYTTSRIERLGSGGAPDLIFVNAGTNDAFTAQTTDVVYEESISDLENLPNSTVKGIALTIRKLQNAYPSAKIVMLIPKQVKLSSMETGYDIERVSKIADDIKAYAEMYGAWKVIDLRKCGINQDNVASYCEDGIIHPNCKGMKEMAAYILQELH